MPYAIVRVSDKAWAYKIAHERSTGKAYANFSKKTSYPLLKATKEEAEKLASVAKEAGHEVEVVEYTGTCKSLQYLKPKREVTVRKVKLVKVSEEEVKEESEKPEEPEEPEESFEEEPEELPKIVAVAKVETPKRVAKNTNQFGIHHYCAQCARACKQIEQAQIYQCPKFTTPIAEDEGE